MTQKSGSADKVDTKKENGAPAESAAADPSVKPKPKRRFLVKMAERPQQASSGEGGIADGADISGAVEDGDTSTASSASTSQTTGGVIDKPLQELTVEELKEIEKRQKKNRQRKIMRNAAFKIVAFLAMVMFAMLIKQFQEWMQTTACARVYAEGTDLFVKVEILKDPEGEDLCMDEVEFAVKNAKPYDGPLFMASKPVLRTIADNADEDTMLDGIHVQACATIASNDMHDTTFKTAACRAGNAAQAVVLCHGKRKTDEWDHQKISDIYPDYTLRNKWLHIDVDEESHPDIVADVANTNLPLAAKYKVIYARRCPIEVFTKGTEFASNVKSWMGSGGDGKGTSAEQSQQEDDRQEEIDVEALLHPRASEEDDGALLPPLINEKKRLVVDNILWMAWRFDWDIEDWVQTNFGPPEKFRLMRYSTETLEVVGEFDSKNSSWWKEKVKEMNAKTENGQNQARIEALRGEWGWTVDGYGAMVVQL
ncbi:unnamed protein product [Amoebophrya sp. A25]|nr:unnamed protein product [Amoebophrya sp. A25]|eukprot:GSA25T00017364001.1